MNWNNVKAKVASLLSAQDGLLVSFGYDGVAYVGVRSQLRAEAVNTSDGLAGSYRFSLTCSADQFGNVRPRERDVVDIDGDRYRILTVDADAVCATIRLNLGDEYA